MVHKVCARAASLKSGEPVVWAAWCDTEYKMIGDYQDTPSLPNCAAEDQGRRSPGAEPAGRVRGAIDGHGTDGWSPESTPLLPATFRDSTSSTAGHRLPSHVARTLRTVR
jgi:hypothetical protein